MLTEEEEPWRDPSPPVILSLSLMRARAVVILVALGYAGGSPCVPLHSRALTGHWAAMEATAATGYSRHRQVTPILSSSRSMELAN